MKLSVPDVTRFWKGVRVEDNTQCWPWIQSRTRGGYGQFWLQGKMRLAHRVVFALYFHSDVLSSSGYHAGIDKFPCVLHNCDNPACCNPHHLRLGTNAENIGDKVAKGRGQRMCGARNGHSKLSADAVRQIRQDYQPRSSDRNCAALGERYGVSTTNIHDIVRRKVWRHI